RLGDVQRFDAEPIPPEDETAAPRIPEREGEHALESRDRLGPVLLVEVDDDLDVRGAAEVMAAGLERGAERRAVVYLAVADDLDRAVLVAERLVSAYHVDDREPAHAERHLAAHEPPEVVGAAMDDDVAHPAHPLRAGGLTRHESQFACDAAHGAPFTPRSRDPAGTSASRPRRRRRA